MAGTCQTVAAHTSVIFFFIGSLSVRSKAYNDISRTDIGIVNNVRAFHAAGYGRVYDNSTNQVADISSLATGSIYTYTHFTEFSQQFVCSVDDSGDYFAGNQQFIASDS